MRTPIFVACLAALAVLCSACARVAVVAPTDSYVCFATEQTCSTSYLPETWAEHFREALLDSTGQEEVVLPVSVTSTKSDDITPTSVSALDTACPSDPIFIPVQDLATSSAAPLTAAERELKPAHDNACAVFYSPLLLSQYVEDLKRYTYALRSCHRIEEAINRQKSIFALQDEIAMPGMSAETLRTRATSRDMQRTEALSVDERQEFEDNHTFVISGAEAVRREAQAQFLDREFAERLRDAVLQIEVARETVKRQLFVIKDLAAQECGSGTRIKPLVLDGAWVTKGLPVLSVIKP